MSKHTDLIRLTPLSGQTACPVCGSPVKGESLLWQGIHLLRVGVCADCGKKIATDVAIDHAERFPYQLNLTDGELFGSEEARSWLGEPLLQSLLHPETVEKPVSFTVQHKRKEIIVLNCLDYLYGHALLKLLNLPALLRAYPDQGVVVLIQPFLRWLVPKDVAEIWEVSIPLKYGRSFFPSVHAALQERLKHYDSVQISTANTHPRNVDLSSLTGIPGHDWESEPYRVTFIWREDRPWFFSFPLSFVARRLRMMLPFLWLQNFKVRRLFFALQREFPQAQYTVAGLGTTTRFPDWIDDQRVQRMSEKAERSLVQVYAQSRLVIGVHGSNLLLPSGHAGMVIDLLPSDRDGNIAQDIVYPPQIHALDPAIISFRYRYLPIDVPLSAVQRQARTMLKWWRYVENLFS